MSSKHGGSWYAKKKIERLTETVRHLKEQRDDLQSTIEKQSSEISRLTAELASAEKVCDVLLKDNEAMWQHMGWFKRFTWRLKCK